MDRDPLLPGGDDDPLQSDSLNDSAAETSPGREAPAHLARLVEFERLYRSQFGPVVSYFARRYDAPQLVADLTADTFVAAIQSFREFDPQETSQRAWAIGIARRVWLRYRGSDPRAEDPARRDSLQRLLDGTETKELMWWIEVERSSRELMERLGRMSRLDGEALELVELCELTPAEAARELGISSGALRVRLIRSRARLRREGGDDV
jgi:RNA polymerase sigma-70 factor, ECF subfamily